MRAKQARSLASETLRRTHVEKCIKQLADKDKIENELLKGDALSTTEDDPTIKNVLRSIDAHMAILGNNMSNMSQEIRKIKQTPTVTAKRDSRAVESTESLTLSSKKKRSSDQEGSDVDALIDDHHSEQETESAETKDGDEEDAFLTTLALDYSADDKTSSPVSTQLADIVNKRWLSKLSDDRFKEKIEKYDRPENCERLFAPKVNPEVWSRISNMGRRQDLKLVAIQKTLVAVGTALTQSGHLLMNALQTGGIRRHEGGENNTMNEVLTLQVDALALLGHTNYDLSLRRREMMKPSLNKEYASLCSSQTSVTSMLFGDELQSQLNAIRASNRISQTATQSTTGHFVSHNKSTFQRHPRNDREKSFLSKGPNPRWSNNRQVQQEVTAIDKDIITHLSKVKVNEFLTFLPVLKEHFNMQISHFRGGRLAHFYHEWEKITSDREILDIVNGQRIHHAASKLSKVTTQVYGSRTDCHTG